MSPAVKVVAKRRRIFQGDSWPLPQPGQPGVQVHAGCDGSLLADRGDDGDAQLARMLKVTRWEAQERLQFQDSYILVFPPTRKLVLQPSQSSKTSNKRVNSSPIFASESEVEKKVHWSTETKLLHFL